MKNPQAIRARWQIGINVPWNASWTGEDAYEIRNCRWVGMKPALWSPHKLGEGKPVFAKPHMVRQRRSVAEYRCTVCGECTDPLDRWWFGNGDVGTVPGWAMVTTEAPVHYDCARVAHRVCPHLQQQGTAPVRWNEPHARLVAVVGGPATDRDYGLNLGTRKVIGHLKFAWRHIPVWLENMAAAP